MAFTEVRGMRAPDRTPESLREQRPGRPGQPLPGVVARRELVEPDQHMVLRPLRGRWLRPRAREITQTPGKLLDANPNRLCAWIFNNGGMLELPIGLPAFSTMFMDSASVQVPSYSQGTFKTLILQVDVAFAWVTAAQAKLQLLIGRGPWSPAGGAASQAGGNANNFLKGAAANLGGAGATALAVGVWPFSPADIVDLQWQFPFIGAELSFGSALTAGAARLFLEMEGGPALHLGSDSQIDASVTGDRAGTFVLPTQAAPFRFDGDGELWAAASPGGVCDVRIQEVLLKPPSPMSAAMGDGY